MGKENIGSPKTPEKNQRQRFLKEACEIMGELTDCMSITPLEAREFGKKRVVAKDNFFSFLG